jgi:signal transduction histidine kinase/PAS domain-containing protein
VLRQGAAMSIDGYTNRARDYLRLVFAQIPGALWATDRELRVTFVHGRTPRLDDERAAQLVGRTVYEFVGTTDPTEPAIAHHLAALAGTRQSFAYERQGRTFEVLVEPLLDDGHVVGCIGAAIDVTERRIEQARLARSEARLAEAQRVAHVGSFEWDLANDAVTSSEELWRIYGIPPGTPPETFDTALTRIHPDDRPRFRQALLETARDRRPLNCEHRVVRPDGEVRVIHTVGDAVSDPGGATARVVGSCWDVTVQHETMARLQQSVAMLEATLDATADGILVVGSDGRITAHNRRFLELWRVPPEMMEKADDATLLSSVAYQLENPRTFRDGVRDSFDSPEQHAFEILHFKDGRIFERFSRPQVIGGRVAGRVWSFRDVTIRERLLQRANFLADAARLMASLDTDRALASFCGIATPFLGEYCAIDLLHNGASRRIVGPSVSPLAPLPEPHRSALNGHSVIYAMGHRSVVAVPLLVRDAVTGVITLVAPPERTYTKSDCTFVEELARRLSLSLDNARLFESAREALDSRDEFLAIAAHEIRGPLTSIHLAAQGLLGKSLPPEAARTALDVIQCEDRRLGRFVDDLLDLGRARTGQLYLTLQDVDMGTIVRDVVSRMAGDAAEAGCAVSVKTDGNLMGHWDATRLEQVVTNLVSNAFKFGRGKPVEIAAQAVESRVRVRVTDHGIGIEPAMLPRIFDRFERAVEARHYGGLGLGLHIAKTIVDGLGGTLTVASRPGHGATFTLELPSVRSSHEAHASDHGGR